MMRDLWCMGGVTVNTMGRSGGGAKFWGRGKVGEGLFARFAGSATWCEEPNQAIRKRMYLLAHFKCTGGQLQLSPGAFGARHHTRSRKLFGTGFSAFGHG